MTVRAAETDGRVLRLALVQAGHALRKHLQGSRHGQNVFIGFLVDQVSVVTERIVYTYGVGIAEQVRCVLCCHVAERDGAFLQRIEFVVAVLLVCG